MTLRCPGNVPGLVNESAPRREIPPGGLYCPKRAMPFLDKKPQSAARIICSPMANKFHTCRLRSIFCQVHAPAKNGLHLICRLRAANSARLFGASCIPPAGNPAGGAFCVAAIKNCQRAKKIIFRGIVFFFTFDYNEFEKKLLPQRQRFLTDSERG